MTVHENRGTTSCPFRFHPSFAFGAAYDKLVHQLAKLAPNTSHRTPSKTTRSRGVPIYLTEERRKIIGRQRVDQGILSSVRVAPITPRIYISIAQCWCAR